MLSISRYTISYTLSCDFPNPWNPRHWTTYAAAYEHTHQGNALITPSNATSATAFAGKALKKQGKKPLQYPFQPLSLYTSFAALFQLGNLRTPSPNPPASGSVIILCLTTSLG